MFEPTPQGQYMLGSIIHMDSGRFHVVQPAADKIVWPGAGCSIADSSCSSLAFQLW